MPSIKKYITTYLYQHDRNPCTLTKHKFIFIITKSEERSKCSPDSGELSKKERVFLHGNERELVEHAICDRESDGQRRADEEPLTVRQCQRRVRAWSRGSDSEAARLRREWRAIAAADSEPWSAVSVALERETERVRRGRCKGEKWRQRPSTTTCRRRLRRDRNGRRRKRRGCCAIKTHGAFRERKIARLWRWLMSDDYDYIRFICQKSWSWYFMQKKSLFVKNLFKASPIFLLIFFFSKIIPTTF